MSKYRHTKTGGVYELLHLALDEANPGRDVAVYQSVETGQVWIRDASAFFGLVERATEPGAGPGLKLTVRRFEPVIELSKKEQG